MFTRFSPQTNFFNFRQVELVSDKVDDTKNKGTTAENLISNSSSII